MMAWYYSGGLMIGMVLVLMLLRVPIAFAFLAADLVGVILFMGGKFGVVQFMANTTTAITGFALVPLPLFVLMGELFYHTGVATRVFTVFDHLLGNVRGRLSFVAIGGGTLFAALSGSSIANVAMMGTTSYPEMKRRGYSTYLSVGPIVATGSLAALIPPSGLAVLLGSLAGIDIGKLLLGGVVPGLILSALYCLVVFVWVRVSPDAAPAYDSAGIGWGEKLKLVVTDLLPMAVVVFMVIGFIILGIATPTESAAFGVAGVMIVAALFRKLTVAAFIKAVKGTLRVTAMILLIILASTTFSQILALSGASRGLIDWILSFNAGPMAILVMIGIVLLILGAFMESVAIMMLTVPIFFPLADAYGINPIWLGVYMLVMLEAGLITPPFGLGLFVMQGVAGPSASIVSISKAVAPYLLCTLVLVALMLAWPQTVLFLASIN